MLFDIFKEITPREKDEEGQNIPLYTEDVIVESFDLKIWLEGNVALKGILLRPVQSSLYFPFPSHFIFPWGSYNYKARKIHVSLEKLIWEKLKMK